MTRLKLINLFALLTASVHLSPLQGRTGMLLFWLRFLFSPFHGSLASFRLFLDARHNCLVKA